MVSFIKLAILQIQTTHHILIGGLEFVEQHFLVEDLREGATDGRDYPDPVGGAPSPGLLLVLHVLHEGLGGRVVVSNGDAYLLSNTNV